MPALSYSVSNSVDTFVFAVQTDIIHSYLVALRFGAFQRVDDLMTRKGGFLSECQVFRKAGFDFSERCLACGYFIKVMRCCDEVRVDNMT